MNVFEHFKYGPQVTVKRTKGGLTKLHSALIEHFPVLKNQMLYQKTSAIRAPANNTRTSTIERLVVKKTTKSLNWFYC